MSNPIFSELFYLEHNSGDKLYPVKMKNKESGKVAFRVSPGGTGGNTKEAGQELECESEVKRLVFDLGYAVRAATKNKSRTGLYKIGMKSISRAVQS